MVVTTDHTSLHFTRLLFSLPAIQQQLISSIFINKTSTPETIKILNINLSPASRLTVIGIHVMLSDQSWDDKDKK